MKQANAAASGSTATTCVLWANSPNYGLADGGSGGILLGRDTQGITWFASAAAATDSLKAIRSVMIDALLPKEELSIVAQARSLVHWHESHAFCARCGNPSRMEDAGYRRHCDACGADHFPRTDPVVIMGGGTWQQKPCLDARRVGHPACIPLSPASWSQQR